MPPRKALEMDDPIIVVRSVFNDGNKCYPKVFSDECLYKAITYYLKIKPSGDERRFLKI